MTVSGSMALCWLAQALAAQQGPRARASACASGTPQRRCAATTRASTTTAPTSAAATARVRATAGGAVGIANAHGPEPRRQSRATALAAQSAGRSPAARPPRSHARGLERARSHVRSHDGLSARHDRARRPRWLAWRPPSGFESRSPLAAVTRPSRALPETSPSRSASPPPVSSPHAPARIALGSAGRTSSARTASVTTVAPRRPRRARTTEMALSTATAAHTFQPQQSFGSFAGAQPGRAPRRSWASARAWAGERQRRWLATTP